MERKTTTKAISGNRSQKERKAVWIAVPIAIAPRLLLRYRNVSAIKTLNESVNKFELVQALKLLLLITITTSIS